MVRAPSASSASSTVQIGATHSSRTFAVCDGHVHAVRRIRCAELVGPLNQQNVAGDAVLQLQDLQIARSGHAVQVNVVRKAPPVRVADLQRVCNSENRSGRDHTQAQNTAELRTCRGRDAELRVLHPRSQELACERSFADPESPAQADNTGHSRLHMLAQPARNSSSILQGLCGKLHAAGCGRWGHCGCQSSYQATRLMSRTWHSSQRVQTAHVRRD